MQAWTAVDHNVLNLPSLPAMPRSRLRETTRPNEQWAIDFIHDVLVDRRTGRVFTLVHTHTRERLALEVAPRFRDAEVAAMLIRVIAERGNRKSSNAIRARSSRRSRSINGRNGTQCSSTSTGLASPSTTASAKPSTAA